MRKRTTRISLLVLAAIAGLALAAAADSARAQAAPPGEDKCKGALFPNICRGVSSILPPAAPEQSAPPGAVPTAAPSRGIGLSESSDYIKPIPYSAGDTGKWYYADLKYSTPTTPIYVRAVAKVSTLAAPGVNNCDTKSPLHAFLSLVGFSENATFTVTVKISKPLAELEFPEIPILTLQRTGNQCITYYADKKDISPYVLLSRDDPIGVKIKIYKSSTRNITVAQKIIDMFQGLGAVTTAGGLTRALIKGAVLPPEVVVTAEQKALLRQRVETVDRALHDNLVSAAEYEDTRTIDTTINPWLMSGISFVTPGFGQGVTSLNGIAGATFAITLLPALSVHGDPNAQGVFTPAEVNLPAIAPAPPVTDIAGLRVDPALSKLKDAELTDLLKNAAVATAANYVVPIFVAPAAMQNRYPVKVEGKPDPVTVIDAAKGDGAFDLALTEFGRSVDLLTFDDACAKMHDLLSQRFSLNYYDALLIIFQHFQTTGMKRVAGMSLSAACPSVIEPAVELMKKMNIDPTRTIGAALNRTLDWSKELEPSTTQVVGGVKSQRGEDLGRAVSQWFTPTLLFNDDELHLVVPKSLTGDPTAAVVPRDIVARYLVTLQVEFAGCQIGKTFHNGSANDVELLFTSRRTDLKGKVLRMRLSFDNSQPQVNLPNGSHPVIVNGVLIGAVAEPLTSAYKAAFARSLVCPWKPWEQPANVAAASPPSAVRDG